MKNLFRQGIITYPQANGLQRFLTRTGNNVNLLVSNTDVLTYTIAHGTSDYLLSETVSIASAWKNLTNNRHWLYVDINLSSGLRTFGSTLLEPVAGANAPLNPNVGQMWYNTTDFTQYVWDGRMWAECLRLVIATVLASDFTPFSIGGANYAGTQIGSVGNVAVDVGTIIFDDSGNPVHTSTGQFYTTTTRAFTTSSLVTPVSIESTVVDAIAQQNVDWFQVIKYETFDNVLPATYNDIQTTTIGITTTSAQVGSVVSFKIQGVITNPQWMWSTVGAPLWVDDTGRLTETNLHRTDVLNHPVNKPPVARVISRTQVIFDQGLGGMNETVSVGGVNVSMADPNTAGIGYLSVPADNPAFPIMVGDNDPRLSGPRPPTQHTHPASEIIPLPVGDLIGNDLQDVLTIINDKLALVGYDMMITDVSFNQSNNVLTIRTNYPDASRFDIDLTYLDTHLISTVFNDTTGILTMNMNNGQVFTANLSKLFEVARTNSTSISMTGNGTTATPIRAQLIVDPAPQNILSVSAAGVLVKKPIVGEVPIVVADSITTSIAGDGSTTTPLTVTVKPRTVPIAISDSSTVSLTGTGVAATPIAANVKLSAQANNLTALTSTGVLTVLTSGLSSTIELSGAGTNASPLVGAVRLNSIASNLLSSSTAGLTATLVTSNTQTVALVGNGTTATPLRANVTINTDVDNLLTQTATGLKVAAGSIDSNVSHANSNSIVLTGIGTPADRLIANIVIDPNVSNRLSVSSAGVLVLPEVPTDGTTGQVLTKTSSTTFGWSSISGMTSVTSANSSTANITGTGTSASPLQVDVRVSTDPQNGIASTAGGLFVDGSKLIPIFEYEDPIVPPAFLMLDENEEPIWSLPNPNSLELTGTGTDTDPYYTEVAVSADVDNAVVKATDGVKVSRLLKVVPVTTTAAHTALAANAGAVIHCTAGTTISLPASLAVGYTTKIINDSTDPVTVSGTGIKSLGNFTDVSASGTATVTKLSPTVIWLEGDLE